MLRYPCCGCRLAHLPWSSGRLPSSLVQVNFCGKLAMDDAAAVRLEFINAAGDWLLHLDERIDHQGRLLPYLITGLTDTHADVQQRALALLEEIGALYEKDNEKDLKDILCYLPEEAHNIGWRSIGDAWHGGHASGLFPAVFQRRPGVGTRRVVASSFAGVVGGIAGELRGWHAECKRRAAGLLEMYSVFVEDWMQQHIFKVVPAMLQAAAAAHDRAADADVVATADAIGRCFSMMGLCVPLDGFMKMVEAVLLDTGLPTGLRAAAAAAVHHFLSGARHRGGADECVRAVVHILLQDGLSDTQSSVLKRSLVTLTGVCIRWAGEPLLQELEVDFLLLLLRLQAWPAAEKSARKEMADAVESHMNRFACRHTAGGTTYREVNDLLAIHQQELLQSLQNGSKRQQDVTDLATLRLQAAAGALHVNI